MRRPVEAAALLVIQPVALDGSTMMNPGKVNDTGWVSLLEARKFLAGRTI
jgi:hypothetical protein